MTVQGKNKKIIAIVVATVIALLAIVIVAVNANSKVDVQEFISNEYKFSGYDGEGQISEDKAYDLIDEMAMLRVTNGGIDILFNTFNYFDVSIEGGNQTGLKNGDKVVVVIKPDYDAYNREFGKEKKLKGDSTIKVTLVVNSLVESKEIDPLASVDKAFLDERYDELHMSFKSNEYTEINGKYISYSENGDFSNCEVKYVYTINGNKVKITLNADSISKGYKVTNLEAEFPLHKEYYATMKAFTNNIDVIKEYVSKNNDDNDDVGKILGIYAYAEDEDNSLFVLYKKKDADGDKCKIAEYDWVLAIDDAELVFDDSMGSCCGYNSQREAMEEINSHPNVKKID